MDDLNKITTKNGLYIQLPLEMKEDGSKVTEESEEQRRQRDLERYKLIQEEIADRNPYSRR